MKDEKQKHAGRPLKYDERGKHVAIYLPTKYHETLKKLGGSSWVRSKIDEEMRKCDLQK